MNLRHFLYRDEELIREFLSQIEGGVFDEAKEIARGNRGTEVGAGASAGPIQAKAGRTKGEAHERERTVRQTGASEYERLHQALGESLPYYETLDESTWGGIRRGQPLELESLIQPTGLGRVAELLRAFETMLPIAQDLGADVDSGIDTKAMDALKLLSSASESSYTVVARVDGDTEYRFACQLKAECILVGRDELEGEATLMGKIQRKLREGESHLLPSVFAGLETMLDSKDQDALAGAFNDDALKPLGLASPRLEHPAAILTPVAIFR